MTASLYQSGSSAHGDWRPIRRRGVRLCAWPPCYMEVVEVLLAAQPPRARGRCAPAIACGSSCTKLRAPCQRKRAPVSRSCTWNGCSCGDARAPPESRSTQPRCAWCGSRLTTTRRSTLAPSGVVLAVGRSAARCRSGGSAGAGRAAAPGSRGGCGSAAAMKSRRLSARSQVPVRAAGTSRSRGTPRCRARAACSPAARRPGRRCRSWRPASRPARARHERGAAAVLQVLGQDVGRVGPDVRAEVLARPGRGQLGEVLASAPACVLRQVK